MSPALVTLLVALFTELAKNMPEIVEAIKNMTISEEDKTELIARIRIAQASLPVWE